MFLHNTNSISDHSSWDEESNDFTNSHQSSNTSTLAKRLQTVLHMNTGYQFIQRNGQRIFEPCPQRDLLPPPKGCEIFVGNIPKHIYEDELIPLFQTVGRIYKFRLMLDFNQRTRGYCFVTFFNPDHVNDAILKFNGYKITNNVALGVYKSIDNRRLFVGNIPRSKTREEVYSVFHSYVDGVVNIIMYSSWEEKDLNRGFAFVEFESHIQASVARRQLHPRNLIVWDQSLYVDWADPVPDVNPLIMAQVTVLYVKNLPLDMSGANLHAIFERIVGSDFIKKTHKIYTYAFVHCKNRKCAEVVKQKLTSRFLEQEIEIEWARPRQYSSQWRALQPPDNFCLSVPLRTRRLVKQMADSRRVSVSTVSDSASTHPSLEASFSNLMITSMEQRREIETAQPNYSLRDDLL